MKYKLLVSDVDGTLINKHGTVSEADKDALARARASGIIVSLCTGRAPQGCAGLLRQLALDGYHTFHDGAQVINPDTEHQIYIQPFNYSTIRQAVEWAHRYDMEIELYSTTQFFAEKENWSTRVHRDFFNIPPVMTDYDALRQNETIIKMQTVRTNPEEAEKINAFCREFADRCHFSWVKSPAFPDADFINILSPQVSKGKAITELAAYLSIRKEEIIAIGDGKNDVSLLSAAGLAIAMESAPDVLKNIAHYITAGVDESGVAKALNKFLSI